MRGPARRAPTRWRAPGRPRRRARREARSGPHRGRRGPRVRAALRGRGAIVWLEGPLRGHHRRCRHDAARRVPEPRAVPRRRRRLRRPRPPRRERRRGAPRAGRRGRRHGRRERASRRRGGE